MHKKILITDVDNTLFDWVEFWGASFAALYAKVKDLSGLADDKLYAAIKEIHQARGTSEYAFMLEELKILEKFSDEKRREIIAEGNKAFMDAREHSLRLYPYVRESLNQLKADGIKVVAYTESFAQYTSHRFVKFKFDGVVDALYSPEHHDGSTSEFACLSHSPNRPNLLSETKVRSTPNGELKPNADILLKICADMGFEPEEAVYVGDSLMKDIAMAQDAGVLDAWAEYGRAQHLEEYELLKKVTHWTDETVEREQKINERRDLMPTITLTKNFGEILDYL